MLILLLPREHLFGNTGTNHNLFGKGDNVMKIPKRHVETAKKHLKLEHFFFVFKEIEHQIVPQKYFYSICILLFIIMLKYVFGARLQMYPFSSKYIEISANVYEIRILQTGNSCDVTTTSELLEIVLFINVMMSSIK